MKTDNPQEIKQLEKLERLEKKLKRFQKQLNRKVKFSSNWYKLEQKITKLRTRIANIRRDLLYKKRARKQNKQTNHAKAEMHNIRKRRPYTFAYKH